MKTHGKRFYALIGALALTGCAVNGDPRDPLEPMNRVIHSFNDVVDHVALKPLATGYRAALPQPAQIAVSNAFSNLDDVSVLANDLLQFKAEQAASDFLRFAFNTGFGVFGLVDVASEMGLKKHDEDFGQTLGRWGLGSGPYLVLPIFGPSSFRDGAGLVVDSTYADPVYRKGAVASRNAGVALRIVSRRADLIEAKQAIEEAALDSYEFSRDFYLDRRAAQVYDGRPPRLE